MIAENGSDNGSIMIFQSKSGDETILGQCSPVPSVLINLKIPLVNLLPDSTVRFNLQAESF